MGRNSGRFLFGRERFLRPFGAGAKAPVKSEARRGAEAPLFHGAACFYDDAANLHLDFEGLKPDSQFSGSNRGAAEAAFLQTWLLAAAKAAVQISCSGGTAKAVP